MNNNDQRADAPDPRRVRVEQMLARYPDLTPAEIADVLHWFRKEASALDTAMVASDDRLTAAYARFRADHLDRLGTGEIFAAVAVGLAVIGGIIAFALM